MSLDERGYGYQRERLVRELEQRGIADRRVLDALRRVPRERFVERHLRRQAYRDSALPIRRSQTISQPYIVARMTELLGVGPGMSVLEIGTGSGYQTAVLAHMARVVYSIERIAELGREAIRRMQELGLQNVKIQIFDGTVGWSEAAPFDRILVTAGAPSKPEKLIDQLAARGRLVVPEGDRDLQRLVIYDKGPRGHVARRSGEAVVFVPLIGRQGWPEEKGR